MTARRSVQAIILYVLTVCMLAVMMSMFAVCVYAGDETSCSIDTAPDISDIEVNRGGRCVTDLNDIFTDSQGHSLKYSVSEADNSLKARVEGSLLKIDPLKIGKFTIKVTAKCDAGDKSVQLLLTVDVVESDDEGVPEQYNYDETPAESVTVYASFSSDGIPLIGNDVENTVLSRVKVTIPYFDLGDYGLDSFYRYHTKDGRGEYVDEDVVERPTAMHFFIYMTEHYYMGIPEKECCKGTSGILEYNTPCSMQNLHGSTAYYANRNAYYLTGDATSTYMESLWGHDENLMYYRNHLYPLMGPGWGSTADYILLSDGDMMDVGMFTDWEFYHTGGFCCFDKDEYEIGTGEDLIFKIQSASSSKFGSQEPKPVRGMITEIYDDSWNLIDILDNDVTSCRYVFNEPGIYHLIGRDVNGGTSKADKAPASAEVKVTDSFENYDFSSIADQNGKLLPKIEISDIIPDIYTYLVSIPDDTTEVNIEWRDLPEYDFKVNYWDPASGKTVTTDDSISRNGRVITVDPEDYLEDEKVLMMIDGQNRCLGAFTFRFVPDDGGLQGVEKAEYMIDAIGEVTLAKKRKIASARKAYDELSDEEKEQVPRKRVIRLTNAERELELLRYLENNSGSEAVIRSQIEQIRTSEQIIFDLLDREEQAQKDKEEAEKAAEEIKAQLNEMLSKIDDLEEEIKAAKQSAEQADAEAAQLRISDARNRALRIVGLFKIEDYIEDDQWKVSAALDAARVSIEAAEDPEEMIEPLRALRTALAECKTKAEKEAEDKAAADRAAEEQAEAERQAAETQAEAARKAAEQLDKDRKQGVNDVRALYASKIDKMYENDRLFAQLFMLQQIILIKDAESKDEIEELVKTVEDDINRRAAFFAKTEAAKAAAKTDKVNKLKAKSKKRKFTVTWKKNSGAEGFDIEYKLSSAGKFHSLKKAVKAETVKTRKLKKGKKYIFRVRTYRTVNGVRIYGAWVKTKAVKCK